MLTCWERTRIPIAGHRSRIDLGRAQSLVGVRRRHPDVDDRDVRLDALDQLEQSLGVGGEPDDFKAGFVEQSGETFAQDHRVVGQRYAHGISARSVVPRPAGWRS